MKCKVISLESKPERRTHITQEFSKQGIDFEFFDAITPNQVTQLAKQHGLALGDAFLTEGEKACFMSHACLWQQMIDENLTYLAVFEDDIYLGENAHLFFSDDEWLKDNALDFVKTETFLQKRKLSKDSISTMDHRTLHVLKESHLGAAGYILSQKAAVQLLAIIRSLNSEQIQPIDVIVFEYLIKDSEAILIHQLLPAICIQEFILMPETLSMPSSLENDRLIKRKQKPKRSIGKKLKGELSNAIRKSFGQFMRTKIEFR
ncbi:glycosyltransferase family 25 protein [Moraxella cuniculi]|uniref:Lipooligosaccharide biosynthesis protein lex-1 n=1 Tax=Moraxella cuniculi TaxID=34061 RepID=A0A448GWV5_9GAMM|nr:glycosyltransferase family 25 protein [Moraxella cuniculi]VEG13283.1 Lipooligosaccharide biosynthesis protein lex-1 [Moraxella cuniculi]